jgi:hypothetical protein
MVKTRYGLVSTIIPACVQFGTVPEVALNDTYHSSSVDIDCVEDPMIRSKTSASQGFLLMIDDEVVRILMPRDDEPLRGVSTERTHFLTNRINAGPTLFPETVLNRAATLG